MESSQIVGSVDDSSVSESGWTKYIVSPTHEKDNSEYINDSDDSMASDASSGPSYLELPCEERFGSSPTKHTAKKKSTGGKLHKQVKTRDGSKNRTEKEEPVRKAKSAASQAQNGIKSWNFEKLSRTMVSTQLKSGIRSASGVSKTFIVKCYIKKCKYSINGNMCA